VYDETTEKEKPPSKEEIQTIFQKAVGGSEGGASSLEFGDGSVRESKRFSNDCCLHSVVPVQ
jgi:hypothetical protein